MRKFLLLLFIIASLIGLSSCDSEIGNKVGTFASKAKDFAIDLKDDIADALKTTVTTTPTTTTETSSATSTKTPTIIPTTTIESTSYEDMFNAYRQSNSLLPLIFTDDLNRIANLRLAEIKNIYSHSSVGGYNNHLAENIVRSTGYLGNKEAFTSWKGSPGHNANMLGSSYKYTGYAIGNGYAVQVFSSYETINGEPQLPDGWYWKD